MKPQIKQPTEEQRKIAKLESELALTKDLLRQTGQMEAFNKKEYEKTLDELRQDLATFKSANAILATWNQWLKEQIQTVIEK